MIYVHAWCDMRACGVVYVPGAWCDVGARCVVCMHACLVRGVMCVDGVMRVPGAWYDMRAWCVVCVRGVISGAVCFIDAWMVHNAHQRFLIHTCTTGAE